MKIIKKKMKIMKKNENLVKNINFRQKMKIMKKNENLIKIFSSKTE